MAAEPSLPVAAADSYFNLTPWWVDGSLPTKALAFAAALLPTFPEGGQGGHPVANWLILIEGLATVMKGSTGVFTAMTQQLNFRQMVDYVYRICWITQQLATQVPAQISGAQQAAVLAAYNANF